MSDRRRRRSIPQNGRPSAGATATRRWRAALAAGTDRTNKEFERRALEAELGRRRVKVSVSDAGERHYDPFTIELENDSGTRTLRFSDDRNEAARVIVRLAPGRRSCT